jgi:tyrosinase
MQVFIHAALLLGLIATPALAQDLSNLVADPAAAIADPAPATAAPAAVAPAATAPATGATAPATEAVVPNLTAPVLNATAAPANNTTLGAASTPAKPKTGGCTNVCRRREIRDYSPDERSRYFSAVRKLQEGTAPTKYDQLVKLHIDAQDFSHNTAYFLPWHRGYLREYEKALQAVDPSQCLPYYNSAIDSQAAEYSPVWGDDYYGGNGGSGDCVTSGPFSGWRPYYPQPHCLQRKWVYGDSLGALYSIENLNQIVSSNDDYDGFREQVEMVMHPLLHNAVGGDLAEMHSPNDPLFYSHHAYVDYVWTQWQRRKGTSFRGPNTSGGSASGGDDCQGLPYKVNDVLDHTKLCYTYADTAEDNSDQYVPPATVQQPEKGQKPDMTYVEPIPQSSDEDRYSSRDRSNLNIVRYPDRVSDAWASKNKYDIKKLREYEDKHRQIIKQCNEIEGYVSPCALWKRPKLCAPLIKKKQKLCCDIPKYGRVNVDYSTDVDPYQAFSNVRKRVEYCSPDVELPPEQYRAKLEQIVGKSAFDGDGSLKKIVGESDVDAGRTLTEGAIKGVTMCLAAVMPFVVQSML